MSRFISDSDGNINLKQISEKEKEEIANCFKCSVCTYSSNRKCNLVRHVRKVYPNDNKAAKHIAPQAGNSLCLICGACFRRTVDLKSHLASNHGKVFHVDRKSFKNEKDFLDRKSDFEAKNNCSYVKTMPANSNKLGNLVRYWQCKRTGKYIEKGTGKRKTKSCGSYKMGRNCTSAIRCEYHVDSGVMEMEICYTHYGHEEVAVKLGLTKKKTPSARLQTQQEILKELEEIKILVDGACTDKANIKESKLLLQSLKETRRTFQ